MKGKISEGQIKAVKIFAQNWNLQVFASTTIDIRKTRKVDKGLACKNR